MEAASFCSAQQRKRYSEQPEQLLKKLTINNSVGI